MPARRVSFASAGVSSAARLLEDFWPRRAGGIEREVRQVAVDVAIDGDLARADKALVDCGLALGIENRAGMLVERRRIVEIVLANGRLDRAGVEVAEAGPNARVGLGRLPAAALALVAQLLHRGPAELA